MFDVSVLRLLLVAITGWLDRREREALACLIEENRLLRWQSGRRRLRFTDDDRRRLATERTAELSARTFCTLPRELSSRQATLPIVDEELSGIREPLMIIPMPTTARPQQRYDHRLRHLVMCKNSIHDYAASRS